MIATVTQLKLEVCYPATPVSLLHGINKETDNPSTMEHKSEGPWEKQQLVAILLLI